MIVILLVLVVGGLWWRWQTAPRGVGRLASVDQPVASEPPLPHVEPGRFTAAVARLDGDVGDRQRNLIVSTLRGVGDGGVAQFDRTLAADIVEKAGHDRARQLLAESGAHALIWGAISVREDDETPNLYWTLAAELQDGGRWGRYQPPTDLHCPMIGTSDLADFLRLLVTTQAAEFQGADGIPMSDQVSAVLDRVRGVAYGSRQRAGMSKPTRLDVQLVLAYVLATYGEQTAQTKLVQEAVTPYRELLAGRPAGADPLPWAMLQNNLGNALSVVGEHEAELPVQRANLERALAAHQSALLDVSHDRSPLAWAMIQSNLGIVLTALGVRQVGPARLEAAVAAFHNALHDRTRERVPLAFALTQMKLGDALRELGKRTQRATFLCDAVNSHLVAWETIHAALPSPQRGSAAADAVARDLSVMKESLTSPDVQECRSLHAVRLRQIEVESPT